MKNTVGKGILFYILIFLAVVVGVLCIFMSILVFSPGTSLFGIAYFSNNANNTISEYVIAGKEETFSITEAMENNLIEKIKIETNYFSISLSTTESVKYSFTISGKTSGLYKKSETEIDNDKIFYTSSFDEATKCLSFSINEPNAMLFFTKTGYITMNIPKNKINFLTNKNLEIVTNSGSVVLAKESLDTVSISNFTSSISAGSLYMGRNFVIANDANITSTTGGVEAYSDFQGQTKIVSKSGKLQIAKSKDIEIVSENSLIKIGDVNGNVKYFSNKGGLLNVSSITGNFNCEEETKTSNINIGTIYGQTLIPNATSSNIRINKAEGMFNINTTSGEVIIDEINAPGDITTTSGSVKFIVNQTLFDHVLNVTTESGNIEARYKNVIGKSVITTQKGTVLVKYVAGTNCIFDLIYSCKKPPKVTQGISTGTIPESGTFHIGHGGTSTMTKTITVSNSNGNTNFDDTMSENFTYSK